MFVRLLALASLGSAAALTYRHEHASPRLSSAGARLWSLRGGATRAAGSGKPKRDEARLSLKFAAYVVAWAVVPTLLRVAYAYVTLPAAVPAPAPSLLQSLGYVSAPAASAPEALPLPQRWQVAVAAAEQQPAEQQPAVAVAEELAPAVEEPAARKPAIMTEL